MLECNVVARGEFCNKFHSRRMIAQFFESKNPTRVSHNALSVKLFFSLRVSQEHCSCPAFRRLGNYVCMYRVMDPMHHKQIFMLFVERTDLLLVASSQLLIIAMCPW